MLQPQSDDDVRPVVEALRRLDPLLDVIWNPKAFIERTGTFSATGKALREPEYGARWQVIRRDKAASLHDEREYTLIVTVCACDWSGKYPRMLDKGAYAPLGDWLVRYMRQWDAAQSHLADQMARMWAEHEKVDALSDDTAAHQEGAERIYRKFGGEYWMGGAQGRANPVTAAALFGESSRGSPPTNTETLPPPGRARVAAALAASTP